MHKPCISWMNKYIIDMNLNVFLKLYPTISCLFKSPLVCESVPPLRSHCRNLTFWALIFAYSDCSRTKSDETSLKCWCWPLLVWRHGSNFKLGKPPIFKTGKYFRYAKLRSENPITFRSGRVYWTNILKKKIAALVSFYKVRVERKY